ncbi:MAG TPA: UvrD-helicase domain-containing protein [Sphingorhabdus sp.]|nr:UvrD-helicase domain-containing protein [Sphingorhabdus sp.]
MSEKEISNEAPWLRGLNPPQREAVLTTEGPVLLLAGAGTGKTAALTARMAQILYVRLAWPSEILAVTFTNKAAREMRERIGAMVGEAVEGMPWLGTFHSIGAKLLRRHAEVIGLQSNFTIIDTDDQIRLLKQLIQSEDLDEKRFPARGLAGMVDRWKNAGKSPADLTPADNEEFANGKGQRLYTLYQARLIALNACDFGDLLLHVVTLLRGNRDILEKYQRQFKYVLVDEYQDTNTVQYMWLRLLMQGRSPQNICCVGDDDQSIYSWRGAEVANILRFEKDFPGAKIIRLEQNYRSTPHILAAASGLINANSGRLGKTLWTELDEGEKVRIIGVWDGPEEARRVGDEIEALQYKGESLNAIAILVRAQHQTREFEDRFIQIGLNYRIVGGFRFYERAEIRDAIAYLRAVNQPQDDLAFERIINTPKRGMGEKAVAQLHIFARQHGLHLNEAAAQGALMDKARPQTIRAMADWFNMWSKWRFALLDDTATPSELVKMIMEESGYNDMLRAQRSVEADGRLANLDELARAMEEYETLGEFLEHVSLVMDRDGDDQGASVTIMTIHAAKGLEYDNIFLVGWEDGVFPSQRALDEGGLASLEEERRLAYVAITRARRRCFIFHAANRRIYGQWTSSIPSRFIEELPLDHIEAEQTMTGGASLWRANWSEHADPFAHLAAANATRAGARGPGWQRAATSGGFNPKPQRVAENTRSAVSLGNKGRSDLSVGMRVFHEKFGYGAIAEIEGNKLEIDFEQAGRKRVMDSFVSVG